MYVSDDSAYLSLDSNEATALSLDNILPMAAGTLYESEPDNTMSQAMTIYNDYDVYGRIYDSSDVDWYKVQFPNAGSANFWMGNIPSGEDFDLEVYNSAGTKLGSSQTANTQELITLNVSANTWYYIKAYGYNGSWSVSNYLLRAKVQSSYGTMGWQYMYSASGPFKKISSNYGPRTSGDHCGFDIVSETSTSINGAGISNVYGGTCIAAGFNSTEGYFARVRTTSIDPNTGNNLVVHYKHMQSATSLTSGSSAAKGAYVGATGSTGDSTGPHLHFQVNKIGTTTYDYASTVNPILFFPNVAFSGDTSIYQSSILMNIEEPLYTSFYYSIPNFVIEHVGKYNFEAWIENVAVPEELNIKTALEYFDIDKETFASISSITGEDKIYDPDILYLDNTELNTAAMIQKFLDEKNALLEKAD